MAKRTSALACALAVIAPDVRAGRDVDDEPAHPTNTTASVCHLITTSVTSSSENSDIEVDRGDCCHARRAPAHIAHAPCARGDSIRAATARVTYTVVVLVRLTVVFLVALAATAAADVKSPCTSCTLDVPNVDGPVPLMVALHGDRDHAANTAKRWRAAAKARGWALLSLECPKSDKCSGSWWKWNGDPAWIIEQVHAVQQSSSIDPARIYLAGWSGGATYIGTHAPEWTDVFAGVVFHGGGHPPSADCPARALPAYFLVGDANPLHSMAKELRAWFDDCKQDLVWDLVKRGDHDKEERALTKAKAISILDWLAARPRT